MDLADLLSANLRAVDQEPHTFLDGKLLVSQKRRLVEISDILTWTEAFTIYQMVLCAAHPHLDNSLEIQARSILLLLK